jgi:hypothetical protein
MPSESIEADCVFRLLGTGTMGPICFGELQMIRVTRIFLAGALAAALGIVVLGCGGAGEKPPSVPKSELQKAVDEMKEKTGGKHAGEKAGKPAEKSEKPEKETEKAPKADKKGAEK